LKDTDVDAVGRRKPGCELLLWVTPFLAAEAAVKFPNRGLAEAAGQGSKTLISAKHDKAHPTVLDLSKYSRNRNLRKIMSEL
jgi:hypothetical protein